MRLPLIAAALVLIAAPAYAQHGSHGAKAHYQAPLRGASQVPPVAGAGSGVADVWYDTASKTLSWKITYSGLTGPVTAAHIHGPAPEGANAGVAIPFPTTVSPIEGSTTLTEPQAAALAAGQFYVNLHTDAHQTGEVRGQLVAH